MRAGRSTRSLDQINTGNVARLEKAWTFHTGDKTGFFESTPLVVDGTMYVTAQNGMYALDAQTGAQLWKFESDGGTRRGLTYWPGDDKTPARLFGSAQERLIALDAKSGRLVPQFGQGGFVDMGTTMASPASLFGDVLITPATTPIIRAWNARTGALLWKFNLVAQPGDPNNKTWEGDSWKAIGGTNTWGYLTIDTERGIVYVPSSIAGENDYVGVTRPGDNLYGTSLVASTSSTGSRLWHQQLVHHDIWDNDLAAHPTLIDVTRNGKTIPAVAEITKMGLLFIFDRVTGEPIFGMEERAVPQSTVPGEKTSPTQPFPLKPPPLARNAIKRSELPTNISPEHTAYCQGLWEKYGLQDSVPYTPWKLDKDVVVFPGAIGGGNWGGVAYNKKLNLVITNVMNAGQWGHLESAGAEGAGADGGAVPEVPVATRCGATGAAGQARGGRGARRRSGGGPPRNREPYRKVTPEGGRFWDPKTQYSCAPTPWGELIAVNANTGDIAWRVPLGSFDELETKGIKAGAAEPRRRDHDGGRPGVHRRHHRRLLPRLRCENGAELWKTKLTVPGHSIPVDLHGQGRQAIRGDHRWRRRISAQPAKRRSCRLSFALGASYAPTARHPRTNTALRGRHAAGRCAATTGARRARPAGAAGAQGRPRLGRHEQRHRAARLHVACAVGDRAPRLRVGRSTTPTFAPTRTSSAKQPKRTTGEAASGGPSLANVDAIFFLGHRDVPIDDEQKKELLAFVRDDGKGFVAAHTGLTAFESWPEFGELLGGRYDGHPWHQQGTVINEGGDFPATRHFPATFTINDEFYQAKNFSPNARVLLRLDVSKMPPHAELRNQGFPLVWVKNYGKGRVMYSSFGHDASIYDNRDVAQMFLEGIKWALGLSEGDATPRPAKTAQ